MKRLDKLLEAYKMELINESQLAKEIRDVLFMDENEKDIQQGRVRRKLLNDFFDDNRVLTPEEIVIEKETQEEIMQFFCWLREAIGDKDWELLTQYVVEHKSFQKIGDEIGITRQGVYARFENVKKKINSLLEYYPGDKEIVKEALLPPSSTLDAQSPTHLGYPHEFLQNINVGGHWGKKRNTGNKVFISDTRCLIPEYLAKSFGCSDVVCTLCDGGKRCRRFPKKKNC